MFVCFNPGGREQRQILHPPAEPTGTECVPVRPQPPVLPDGAGDGAPPHDAVPVRGPRCALPASGRICMHLIVWVLDR